MPKPLADIADVQPANPWTQDPTDPRFFYMKLKSPFRGIYFEKNPRTQQREVLLLDPDFLGKRVRGESIAEDSIGVSEDKRTLWRYSADSSASLAIEDIQYLDIDGLELKTTAASKGLIYGAALDWSELSEDEYKSLVIKEVDLVVAGNALKWAALRPQQSTFNFESADKLYQFCQNNRLQFKGHCLIWHIFNPSWLDAVINPGNALDLMANHISTVVNRFKGKIQYWDVVNEPVDSQDGNKLTNSIWYQALGEQYIDQAFKIAHSTDPSAKLGINDWGLETDSSYHKSRRITLLKLISRLISRDVPIHYVGLQSHLNAGDKTDEIWYRAFIEALRFDFGLEVWVTEIDIDDKTIASGDFSTRDAAVAKTYFDYLQIVLKIGIKGIIGWGLTNKYNWLNYEEPRADRLPKRSFPTDDQYSRTLAHQSIRDAISNAKESRLPNLISNSSFQNGVAGWGIQGSANLSVVPLSGKNYLQVTNRQAGWAGAKFNLPSPPKEGQSWFVSFWVRAANPCQMKGTIKGTPVSGSAQFQGGRLVDVNSTRDTYYFSEISGFTGAQQSGYFFIEGTTSDDYWVRDVKVFLLSEPEVKLSLPAGVSVASYRDNTAITVTLAGFDVGSTHRLQWRNASSNATGGTNETFKITSDPQVFTIGTDEVAGYIALNSGDLIELLIDDKVSNQLQGVY